MKILLIDAYSSTHVGNGALVESSLEQLRGVFPDADYAVLAFDPQSLEELCGCPVIETLWADSLDSRSAMRKLLWVGREALWMAVNGINASLLRRIGLFINPRWYTVSKTKLAALDAYRSADVVVSISGEMLQDKFVRLLPFFGYGYWLAHALGKMVVIFPQSIGPLQGRMARRLVRAALKRCDLVFPRDELSLKTTESLGLEPGVVHLVPDVAVNQPAVDPAAARTLLHEAGIDDATAPPLIGMAISRWDGLDLEPYFDVMRRLCAHVVEDLGGTVLLFSPNMPFRDEISDYEIAKQLRDSLPESLRVVLLHGPYTPRQFKGMLGELDLFISTRMHAAILATMIGTPTITLNTQPKLLGFMGLIGQAERSVPTDDFTFAKVTALMAETLSDADRIGADLITAKADVGQRSLQASRLVQQRYRERPPSPPAGRPDKGDRR